MRSQVSTLTGHAPGTSSHPVRDRGAGPDSGVGAAKRVETISAGIGLAAVVPLLRPAADCRCEWAIADNKLTGDPLPLKKDNARFRWGIIAVRMRGATGSTTTCRTSAHGTPASSGRMATVSTQSDRGRRPQRPQLRTAPPPQGPSPCVHRLRVWRSSCRDQWSGQKTACPARHPGHRRGRAKARQC